MNKFSEDQIKKINSVLKIQKINVNLDDDNELNKTLSDVGIDSLSALGIIVNLEEKFDVHLDDEKIARIKTIKDLLDLLYEQLNSH